MFNNLKELINSNLLNPNNEKQIENSLINYDAGAEILTHFQTQWEELHQINEENALKATKLAEIIAVIHFKIQTDNNNLTKVNQLLNSTPNFKDNIENCVTQIANLHKSFEDVEKALIKYEDSIEKYELDKMKHHHIHQMALYKEKKLGNLEIVKSEMSSKHAQTIIDVELKKQKNLQERQDVFQEAFKCDLETYKTLGSIPKIDVVKKHQPSALLEEIQLDVDDKELNDFLEGK